MADPDPPEHPLRPRLNIAAPRTTGPTKGTSVSTTTTHAQHGKDVLSELAPLHRELRHAIPEVYKASVNSTRRPSPPVNSM